MSRGIFTAIGVFVIGIAAVIAGFFLLDIEKTALNYWAFGSLLFSLVVSMLVMITFFAPKKNKDGVFYTIGLSSAVCVYEIAVVISVFFLKSFKNSLNNFVLLQIAINALFFILVIIIISVSGHLHDSNTKTYVNLQNGEYDKPKRGGF